MLVGVRRDGDGGRVRWRRGGTRQGGVPGNARPAARRAWRRCSTGIRSGRGGWSGSWTRAGWCSAAAPCRRIQSAGSAWRAGRGSTPSGTAGERDGGLGGGQAPVAVSFGTLGSRPEAGVRGSHQSACAGWCVGSRSGSTRSGVRRRWPARPRGPLRDRRSAGGRCRCPVVSTTLPFETLEQVLI